MTATSMTYDQLLTRLIDDGIAEVTCVYAEPKNHYKRDAAVTAFEACRGKTAEEIRSLWEQSEIVCLELRQKQRGAAQSNGSDAWKERFFAYWKRRYETLQYEWLCDVISVGLISSGRTPLAAHLPTQRAAIKYAAVVGVDRGTSHGPAWDEPKELP